jgi:hypothetical protein
MALAFRNVNASPTDPVAAWPYEALVTCLERGLVPDWRPVFDQIRAHPWGSTARRVERICVTTQDRAVANLFRLAVDRAREDAQQVERTEVAERVRAAILASGRTAAEFAAEVGTSASRLSTYASGRVMPSAAMLLRVERVATELADT